MQVGFRKVKGTSAPMGISTVTSNVTMATPTRVMCGYHDGADCGCVERAEEAARLAVARHGSKSDQKFEFLKFQMPARAIPQLKRGSWY